MDLRQHYRDYIDSINAGCKGGTLDRFVHEGIVHNHSSPMTVAQYAQIMIDSQASFPDLNFEVEQLIVDGDQDSKDGSSGNLAVRIKLTFRPDPQKEESFHEHVFYRFEDGKIRQVWSMLDGAGLRWAQERQDSGKSS
jgi:predicted ester cyclase